MHCRNDQPKYIQSATDRLLEAQCAKTTSARFQRLTIQSGERYFYLFCTKHSLEHRRDEIIQWADQLARQLCWRIYETTISAASTREATERKHALFEHRFQSKP